MDGDAAGRHPPGDPSGSGRRETAEERADRRWTEMLQEVRVTQTGAQILFGFLLSVAFTDRFARLGPFDKGLYVVTVVLGALATGALIAPVVLHRYLEGRGVKPRLVAAGARLIVTGLVLLALTVGASLMLLLHVATGSDLAYAVTGAVMAWFALCWLLIPVLLVRRSERERGPGA